jgi:hypothetical protein
VVKQILVAENEEVWELQVRRRHPYPRPRTAMHASVQRYRGHPRLNPFVPLSLSLGLLGLIPAVSLVCSP